jgi:hypothetical protein
MRLTLFERLKPEVKESLDKNKEKYAVSIDLIYKSLSKKISYDDLTMGEISNIYTFSDLNIHKISSWDIRYGENLFEEFNYKEFLNAE